MTGIRRYGIPAAGQRGGGKEDERVHVIILSKVDAMRGAEIFVQHVSARGDELVRRVVLVGGDEDCAAEAGAGLADGATEGVFVATRPARRGEARRAFDRF